MSVDFTFQLASPLSETELADVVAECLEAIESYGSHIEGQEDAYVPEVVPLSKALKRALAAFAKESPRARVLVPTLRSAIEMEAVNPHHHPIQYAIMRFLVERAGECVVCADEENQPQLRTDALKYLAEPAGVHPDFGQPKSDASAPPGEVDPRAVRIVQVLERAGQDESLAIDVRRVGAKWSLTEKKVAQAIIESGAVSVSELADRAKLPAAEVETALVTILRALEAVLER